MNIKLFKLIEKYKTISIIGLGKNVGKTTTLNHLIAASGDNLALTSVGRDGEDVDVVTNTKKPRIFVPTGTVVITAEGLLRLCDITLEILDVLDWATPMGRIVVVRAASSGFVQLAGPSMVAQLAMLFKKLEGLGVGRIFVDGAASRKSLANPGVTQAAVLCTGASISQNLDEVVAQTSHAAAMLALPAHKSPQNGEIYISGIVSDSKIKQLIMSQASLENRPIVADDGSKIFITRQTYEKLLIKQGRLVVKNPINLVAITINPTSPTGVNFNSAEFLTKMKNAVNVPVFNVSEGYDV